MIIGIVSDTHGDAGPLRTALEMFRAGGASAVVHCGDIGSACVAVLGQSGLDCYLVAGNMDRQIEAIAEQARQCGVAFSSEVITVPLGDGRFLAATHGHTCSVVTDLIAQKKYPYVCHGHTHAWRDQRIGSVRVINPGALHRASVHTVALLDTDADLLTPLTV
ncbi:MAG: metallophosphoesterase family protein [Phycisphaerae bacterium]|jgi:hypothetical protein